MIKNRKKPYRFILILSFCVITICVSLPKIQQNMPKKMIEKKTSSELSEEKQKEKEEIREKRLEKLLPRYYDDPELGRYSIETSFFQDFQGVDDRYLQRYCMSFPICAVVRVTAGMENAIRENALLSCYNEYYGTEETKLTKEQKCPNLLNYWNYGCKITMEVEEYLFDRTGKYAPELTVTVKEQMPNGDRFRGSTGMRLVCFFRTSGQNQSEQYRTTSNYAYFLTEENYLVPMDIYFFEDMVRYGGMPWKEYKALILKYADLAEKRDAVLQYMGKTVAKPRDGWRRNGTMLLLEEKKKGTQRELYVLASVQRIKEEYTLYRGATKTIQTEGGLGYLILEENEGCYKVVEGSWDWNRSVDSEHAIEAEFPDRILALASEYGYPDGAYLERIEEEMRYLTMESSMERETKNYDMSFIVEKCIFQCN